MKNSGAPCRLCPRACGTARPYGRCGMSETARIARAEPHFWEEPCISGAHGSGAVFFSGCPLGCVYCQNRRISADKHGRDVTPEQLRAELERLIGMGVHNINLVTPSHFTPAVLNALGDGLPVPVVFNCGGYESVSTLRRYADKVQVYLPDMKYALSEKAARYSDAPDYPETAKAAILEMVRQRGPYVLNDDGLMTSGVLIRHLVLPGALDNTYAVIDWVAAQFPPNMVKFSLMGQYTPMPSCPPELNRPLRRIEYKTALRYLRKAGITDGYIQYPEASGTQYIPDFT